MDINFLELLSDASSKKDFKRVRFLNYILEKYTGCKNLFAKVRDITPYLEKEDLSELKKIIEA